MTHGRIRTIAIAGALAGAAAAAGWSGSPVSAGTAGLSIDIFVDGANAEAVTNAIELDIQPSVPATCTQIGAVTVNNAISARKTISCPGDNGTVTVGITGAPAGADVSIFCNPPISPANEADTSQGGARCTIDVRIPTVLLDKTVAAGTAATTDFTLEIYDSSGGPTDGTLVTTAVDPSAADCDFFAPDASECAIVGLLPGTYQLGEVTAAGYLPTNAGCASPFDFQIFERFPSGVGEFELPFFAGEVDEYVIYCQLTNQPFEGELIVDKVVVNDDGGTAGPQDFTAEVFTEPGGVLSTSAQCVAAGTCINTTLPIGEYRIGESGPAGYTASVVCAVTRQPDPPTIGTTPPTFLPVFNEALPGPTAVATLEPFGQVTCTITNDDVPPPTTTTSTTTTTTTSTLPPTTQAPTTIDPNAAPVLPATGGQSELAQQLLLAGLVALLAGGTMLLARRRA